MPLISPKPRLILWVVFVTNFMMETTTGSPLPLTTPFMPPSECLNDFWLLSSDYKGDEVTWANLGPGDTQKCLPSGWAPSSYYSPGISCPSGWAMSANWTTNGETVGTCCPIHQRSSLVFTIRTADIGKFPWFNTEVCQFGPTAAMSYTFTYTNIDGITKSASEHRSAGVGGWNAYGVELRWKSTDLNSAPATTFVSPTTSAITATTTTTTASGFSDQHPGLSTGAKAGIGVGAALGGTLAIMALGLLILRGRKRVSKDVNEVSDDLLREKHQHKTQELGSNPLFEMDGCQGAHPQLPESVELEGRSSR